ncbi:MAG: KEOPS complex subunit Cgi121 [Candidatus Odinarchaeota archaeon]
MLSNITRTEKIGEKPLIQFFNADNIAGWMHLYTAAHFTVKNLLTSSSKIKSVELELLRWVSAQKQLSDAITIIGVKETDKRIALLSIGCSESEVKNKILNTLTDNSLTEDLKLLEIDSNKIIRLKKIFQIPDEEFNQLIGDSSNTELNKNLILKLVINRMSALIIKK